ncbi:Mitochondrial distribution and morphology protein 12 [Erysiphe neolycopersici]|uniref:Mitochondrial distribution and morphology protein 12 n=1 Tax=Erysiphe neolycopersici TaxID=212602 RepID=A0A420HBD6_9PEZI|nr:Mitochondrial distribution and morphology protein 12 [Erysiphe neolycopersici]
MSIDINWTTLTAGPDGIELTRKIRDFIHDKFQTVPLPRFIKSVKVQTFDFGSISPEIEIKDICDPFPCFYEDVEGNESDSENQSSDDNETGHKTYHNKNLEERRHNKQDLKNPEELRRFLVSGSPGIPGGTSNLNYFHNQLTGGLSGTRTPLAAVAGAHFCNGWSENSVISKNIESQNNLSPRSTSSSSVESLGLKERKNSSVSVAQATVKLPQSHFQKPRIEDIQTVFRVRYAGDVKLSLTAEILLDYPMPSFVSIPVQLRVTGLSFDGVAVLAFIRKRAHFCFLSPEDALLTTGNETNEDTRLNFSKTGGLLQEIKVESEIGKRETGKQVLKNVGKVEKFVLEQVRRIIEDEFVYPSFWTFLI